MDDYPLMRSFELIGPIDVRVQLSSKNLYSDDTKC